MGGLEQIIKCLGREGVLVAATVAVAVVAVVVEAVVVEAVAVGWQRSPSGCCCGGGDGGWLVGG